MLEGTLWRGARSGIVEDVVIRKCALVLNGQVNDGDEVGAVAGITYPNRVNLILTFFFTLGSFIMMVIDLCLKLSYQVGLVFILIGFC